MHFVLKLDSTGEKIIFKDDRILMTPIKGQQVYMDIDEVNYRGTIIDVGMFEECLVRNFVVNNAILFGVDEKGDITPVIYNAHAKAKVKTLKTDFICATHDESKPFEDMYDMAFVKLCTVEFKNGKAKPQTIYVR